MYEKDVIQLSEAAHLLWDYQHDWPGEGPTDEELIDFVKSLPQKDLRFIVEMADRLNPCLRVQSGWTEAMAAALKCAKEIIIAANQRKN
jgi:hypothetical protein